MPVAHNHCTIVPSGSQERRAMYRPLINEELVKRIKESALRHGETGSAWINQACRERLAREAADREIDEEELA